MAAAAAAAAAAWSYMCNININISVVSFAADWFEIQQRLYLCITSHLLPGPRSWSYFFTPFFLPVVLLMPPHMLSHGLAKTVVYPLMIASTVHAWIAMQCFDVASLNILLWSGFLIAFNNARGDFVRIMPERSLLSSVASALGISVEDTYSARSKETKDGPSWDCREAENNKRLERPTESYPASMLPRMDWVASLIYSTRMHGWLTQKHGDTRPPSVMKSRSHPSATSRIRFAAARLAQASFNLCTLALILGVARTDPWFDQPRTISILSPWTETSIPFKLLPWRSARQFLHPALLRPLVIGGYIYNFVTLPYNLCSPFVVLVNYLSEILPDEWSPHQLSPLFGSFTSGVLDEGIAGFWGTWWHQHMRVFYSAPGGAITDALRIPKHATSRYLLLIFSAFFFSGVTHMGLVPARPILLVKELRHERLITQRAWILRLKIATFFWLQPFAIALELFLHRARPATLPLSQLLAGHRRLCRTFHFLFVLVWLCLTLPLFAEPMAELGYWKVWRIALPDLEMFICGEKFCALTARCAQLEEMASNAVAISSSESNSLLA